MNYSEALSSCYTYSRKMKNKNTSIIESTERNKLYCICQEENNIMYLAKFFDIQPYTLDSFHNYPLFYTLDKEKLAQSLKKGNKNTIPHEVGDLETMTTILEYLHKCRGQKGLFLMRVSKLLLYKQ